MKKEKFLTIGWNNLLSIVFGVPALAYILMAFTSSLWETRTGLVWLSLIGVLY